MLTPRALLEGKVALAAALSEPRLWRVSGITLKRGIAHSQGGSRHIGCRRIGTDLYAGTWLPTAWCHSGTSGFNSGK